jgi:hypothetical protein
MSLVALAMRLTLCEALDGKTLAGSAVRDSNVTELDEMLKEGETRSIITVATDEQEGTFDGPAYDLANRKLDLVIEIAVKKGVRVQIQEAEDSPPQEAVVADIAGTDGGLEMSVDLIARQIMAIMQAGDAWSDLFRRFAGKPLKFTSKRGAGWEKGFRFAARQIVVTFDPLHEPPFGRPPDGAFSDLVDKLSDAGAPLNRYAPLIAKVIEGAPIPEWRQLQVDLGLSDDAARAHGAGAQSGSGEEPTPAAGLTSDGDHLGYTVTPPPDEEEPGP